MSETAAAPMPQNKMGIAPINRLLITMALPMMISMLVMALYNIVDSIYVAQLSEDALTAVSLAFPVQNLMIAIGVGTGVGVNALLSKSLGEKDYTQANRAAINGLFLNLCSMAGIMLFGFTCVKLFFHSQTDDAVIFGYGVDYLTICCVFSFGLFLQTMVEKLLVATGKTVYSMIIQLTGAIINIILDPIMIFGLYGCPALGVKGAAIATVIGQTIAGLLGLWLNMTLNREIRLDFRRFRPHGPTIKRIYSVGLPSIIMQSVGSVMTFCLNRILMSFTPTAVAVFGVYFKLQSFVFMPIFGINNGMVPILSFNYGAHKPERMVQTMKLAVTYALCIMGTGTVVFQLVPELLLGMFKASPEMLAIGVPALRIISTLFPFAAFGIIATSSFQALGKGVWAMLTSLARQLGLLLPAAFLLSLTGRLELVWLAFPIAEGGSVVLCIIFLRRIWATIIAPLRRSVATGQPAGILKDTL